jgi:DeoR/GlpR family transcriptional regulator of sugar metabolism
LLIDHTKVGKEDFTSFCQLNELTAVVIDVITAPLFTALLLKNILLNLSFSNIAFAISPTNNAMLEKLRFSKMFFSSNAVNKGAVMTSTLDEAYTTFIYCVTTKEHLAKS